MLTCMCILQIVFQWDIEESWEKRDNKKFLLYFKENKIQDNNASVFFFFYFDHNSMRMIYFNSNFMNK